MTKLQRIVDFVWLHWRLAALALIVSGGALVISESVRVVVFWAAVVVCGGFVLTCGMLLLLVGMAVCMKLFDPLIDWLVSRDLI